MKPTADEIEQAVEAFEALPYFPIGSVGAKTAIMGQLNSMVATKEQLRWLVDTMLNQAGVWKGPAQLRALYCVRFSPADGVEAKEHCQVAGFTPADCEADHQAKFLPSPDRRRLPAGEPEADLSADPEWNAAVKELEAKIFLQSEKARVGAGVKYEAPKWMEDVGRQLGYPKEKKS